MMGCGSSRGCGCIQRSKSLSYEDESSSGRSSLGDAVAAQLQGQSYGHRQLNRPQRKGLFSAFSPRNLFKGFKSDRLSMSKVERSKYFFTSLREST